MPDVTVIPISRDEVSVVSTGFEGRPGQLDPEDRAKLEAALAAADATISSAPGNIIQSLADGLYVPPPQLASENW